MFKLMVVEDDKSLNKLMATILAKKGYEVIQMYSAEKALDYYYDNVIDLIISDIMMPGMGGETTLSKLKEKSNFNTPVIALTADAVSGAKEKYISLGFTDYIAKPFSRDQIKEKLDKIFED